MKFTTNKIKRLPKGHKVIFCMTKQQIINMLPKTVTYTLDGEKVLVEGFVTGDTEENGLSCVALDEPTYCLCHLSDAAMHTKSDRWTRHRITKGLDDWWWKEGRTSRGSAPSCPY
jgi:hypothetical protein